MLENQILTWSQSIQAAQWITFTAHLTLGTVYDPLTLQGQIRWKQYYKQGQVLWQFVGQYHRLF